MSLSPLLVLHFCNSYTLKSLARPPCYICAMVVQERAVILVNKSAHLCILCVLLGFQLQGLIFNIIFLFPLWFSAVLKTVANMVVVLTDHLQSYCKSYFPSLYFDVKDLDIQPLERTAYKIWTSNVAASNSFKHFCLPMWSDNTLHKLVIF